MVLRSLSILLFFSFTIQSLHAQISISDARILGAGNTVTVRGMVTNGPEFGNLRYFQDGIAGLAAFSSSLSSVMQGDSIELTGTLVDYYGLLEFNPVTSFNIISSGNLLPAPIQLSLNQAFAEQYESRLVQLSNVTKTGGAGTFAGNTNYQITDGSVTKELRVSTTTDIPGKAAPGSAFGIIGIMSQFNAIYQILPRSYNDLLLPGPRISGRLQQDSISTTSFRVKFQTVTNGTTIIRFGLTPSLELGTITDNTQQLIHSGKISGLSPATFYYVKAVSKDLNGDSSATNTVLMSTASLSSGNIKVYFTSSVDTSVATLKKAIQLPQLIDDTLIAYINRAKFTIDLAIYNINNSGLSDMTAAFNNAHGRGVRVRIVADGGNANLGLNSLNPAIQVIKSPQTSAYGIMHNKFLVLDGASANPDDAIVWTGGTNLTSGQINTDVNNVVIIYDQSVAKAYTAEFEEMFGSTTATPNATAARFGPFKTDNTPHEFNVGGRRVEVYFSPSDGTNNRIIEGVKSAQNDLFFETMVFTRTDIATAIRDQLINGTYGAGMVNDTSSGGIPFNIIKSAMGSDQVIYNKAGIMHSKTAIFDANASNSDPMVLTGSHNWSTSAETRNDENTVVIHDDTIANIFYQEFSKRYKDHSGGTLKGFANFKPDKYVIEEGQTVNFKNLSTLNASSWSWDFGDASSGSNAKDPSHSYANSGDYSVRLIASGASTDTSYQLLLIKVIPKLNTSVDKRKNNELFNMNLYPNPANETFAISFESVESTEVIIQVIDVTGRIVLTEKRKGTSGANLINIPVSELQDGLYFVKLQPGTQSIVKRLLIAH